MNHFLIAIQSKVKYLFLAAAGLLSPIKFLLVIVGVFILIDTVLGIWNAKKQQIAITSNRLASVLSKMFVYQGIVILAYAIDVSILGGIVAIFVSVPLLITKIATIMVLINEAYSIDEKIRNLNDGKGTWFYFKRSIGVAKVLKKEYTDFDFKDVDKNPKLEKDDDGELIG